MLDQIGVNFYREPMAPEGNIGQKNFKYFFKMRNGVLIVFSKFYGLVINIIIVRKKVWALSLSAGCQGDGFEYNSCSSMFTISVVLTKVKF